MHEPIGDVDPSIILLSHFGKEMQASAHLDTASLSGRQQQLQNFHLSHLFPKLHSSLRSRSLFHSKRFSARTLCYEILLPTDLLKFCDPMHVYC